MRNSEENNPATPNDISEHTGQLDIRLILWRRFCKENNLSVGLLPSELSRDLRKEWEKLKVRNLRKKAR
ncbi:MAG: hypothetical protein ACRD4L_02005 [Pyrinomonadaceae bacterium]